MSARMYPHPTNPNPHALQDSQNPDKTMGHSAVWRQAVNRQHDSFGIHTFFFDKGRYIRAKIVGIRREFHEQDAIRQKWLPCTLSGLHYSASTPQCHVTISFQDYAWSHELHVLTAKQTLYPEIHKPALGAAIT